MQIYVYGFCISVFVINMACARVREEKVCFLIESEQPEIKDFEATLSLRRPDTAVCWFHFSGNASLWALPDLLGCASLLAMCDFAGAGHCLTMRCKEFRS